MYVVLFFFFFTIVNLMNLCTNDASLFKIYFAPAQLTAMTTFSLAKQNNEDMKRIFFFRNLAIKYYYEVDISSFHKEDFLQFYL